MTSERTDLPDRLFTEISREAGDVDPADVRRWFARGWIDSRGANAGESFLLIAARRAILIQNVRTTLGVPDDSIEVVLSLIDRLHMETRKLACLNDAIDAAPDVDAESVRLRAIEIFRNRMGANQ